MSTLSVFRRDPFFAEFDQLVRSSLNAPSSAAGEALDFTPTAETLREGDDVVVRLDLPGVDIADVAVEVTHGRLVISGERRDERTDETGADRTIREVRYGRFRRAFSLPAHVTADAVSAGYDRGVLSVRVAGVHAGTTPTRIAISDGADASDQA